MVRIRLRRVGLKVNPVTALLRPIKKLGDGRFLEIPGLYNPRTNLSTFQVDEERVYHWLKNGAQPSESVAMLFRSVGLDKRYERVEGGEAAETVLKEAEAYYATRKVNTQTN